MASIVRADPFTDLAASWQRDIDRMFRSLAESFGSGGTMAHRSEWLPAADVLTRGDDLVIRVEQRVRYGFRRAIPARIYAFFRVTAPGMTPERPEFA